MDMNRVIDALKEAIVIAMDVEPGKVRTYARMLGRVGLDLLSTGVEP